MAEASTIRAPEARETVTPADILARYTVVFPFAPERMSWSVLRVCSSAKMPGRHMAEKSGIRTQSALKDLSSMV